MYRRDLVLPQRVSAKADRASSLAPGIVCLLDLKQEGLGCTPGLLSTSTDTTDVDLAIGVFPDTPQIVPEGEAEATEAATE